LVQCSQCRQSRFCIWFGARRLIHPISKLTNRWSGL